LLNGGFTGAVFQIGANAGDSITINSIANSTASNLGSEVTYNIANTRTITAITTLSAIAAGGITLSGTLAAGSTYDVDMGAIASASSYQERAGQIVAAINDKFGQTGVQAFISSGNKIILQSQDNDFTLSGTKLTTVGAGITAANAGSAATTGVSNLSVSTYSASQIAIALVDDALSTVNSTRSTLGATQSRFESAVSSQMTTAENLSSSRSRIMDADFAAETANLAKAQILQQSGIAMLAQANAIPQNVLALLQ
jgi:flagellin